ncbi:MAG: DNA-binding response regulator [Paucibacter sp.]|nr:DNA-binding response regulator [Roseateles sp.]
MPGASGLAAAALILLIDDVPEELRWLTALLKSEYRLALAYDGRSGLQRAQALRPDLILLDIGLPDIDGQALCRLLKADPLTAAIPVLFVSANNAPEQRVRGLELGAVDFISKPFHPEEVLARVRVHLRLAERLAERPAPPMADAASRHPEAPLLQVALQFIRQHLAELSGVAQVAAQVGLSEKRLLALFREHLGLTVSGFISDERVRTGQRLLEQTLMSVQDVAFAVGFSNPGNFATAFRERHGLSPQAYRQALHDNKVLSA